MMTLLRTALLNFSPEFGNIEANLARIEQQVQSLSSDGVQLVCFPEMCLTGYGRSTETLDFAQDIDCNAIRQLTHLAKTNGIAILVGMPEWEPTQKRAYITQVCCMPDSRIFAYRKTHLSLSETKNFHAGDDLGVFNLLSFTIGLQLCYDAHFPEFSLAQALAGAQILVVCSASPMGSASELYKRWLRYLPARAYDTGSYVLVCNQQGASSSDLSFSGLTMAFDPDGNLIAENRTVGRQCIVDLDLELVEKARQKRAFLRLRRPELYQLTENRNFR